MKEETFLRILVLGSEGQIGNPFCNFAKSKGHNVIRFDKVIDSMEDLSTPDGAEELESLLSLSHIDVCVFLAFEVGGSKYLDKVDKQFSYIHENILLMANTFELLRKFKIRTLFASSQMSTMYHTNYGLLKQIGERYARSLDMDICRFWNVYGKEDPNSEKSHVITDFVHMAKTTGVIKMRTHGNEQRQFLHTDDCSKALLHWCENPQIRTVDYLDITSFEWVSIAGIASIVQQLTGAKIEIGAKEDDIQIGILNKPDPYFMNISGWEPIITLKEGIKTLL